MFASDMPCKLMENLPKWTFTLCCVNFVLLVYTGERLTRSANKRQISSNNSRGKKQTMKDTTFTNHEPEDWDLLDYDNDSNLDFQDEFDKKKAMNSNCDLATYFNRDKSSLFPFTKDPMWPGKRDFLCVPKLENFHKRTFIVYVESAPKNFEMRSFIRQTWALDEYYATNSQRTPFTLAVLFVIGIPDSVPHTVKSENIIQMLGNEIEEHGDILLLNMSDHYDHLTYKGIASLTWINNTVNEKVTHVFKTDDDSFVNAMGWMSIIIRLKRVTKSSRYIVGTNCAFRSRVIRDPRVKHNPVSFQEYRPRFYPPYCMGSGYLMSRDAIVDMLEAIHRVPFLKVEDVYFTGMVAKVANITRYWTTGMTEKESANVWQLGNNTRNMPLIVHHMPKEYLIWQSLWHMNQDAYDKSALNWNRYPVQYFAGPHAGVDVLQ